MSKRKDSEEYYVSDNRGYVMYVTGVEKTVEDCRKSVYDRIEKISIPKMMYRNDIGLDFVNENASKLKKWGYL